MTARKQLARMTPLRAAFFSPFNAVLLGAFALLALSTRALWVMGAAALAETAWLSVSLLGVAVRRRKKDGLEAARRRAEVQRMHEQAAELPYSERRRTDRLARQALELRKEVRRRGRGAFLEAQVDRVDSLMPEFIHLAVTAHRSRQYLTSADAKRLNRERDTHRRIAEGTRDEKTRRLALENMALVEQRLGVLDELRRFASHAEGQLQKIENTLALLRDKLMVLPGRAPLDWQLDDVLATVDAICEATREVEVIMGVDGAGSSERLHEALDRVESSKVRQRSA